MKRSVEALVMVEMVAVIVATAIVGLCGIARAEPVQQFAFQVESLQPEHVAVHVHLRRFDTTGAVPPTPTELAIRLPRGVGLNRAFLTPRCLCDGRALRDALDAHISVFLSRGTLPGAIAAFTAIGAADERSAIVRRYPVVAGVHAVEVENLVSDPTPDARYGLKFEIDTGPINGFQLSRAQVDVTIHTLVLRKGTCLATAAGGGCTHRQRAEATLFAVPRCPASGRFSAQLQLLSTYAPPTPAAATSVDVPCQRYAP